MASMISYVGRIRFPDEEENHEVFDWDNCDTLSSNLIRLSCPYRQLKVLLEQALGVAYYVKFMGLRCHEVINDFIDELNADICDRFNRKYEREFTDNYREIYNTLQGLVKFNRGGNWTDVNISLVSEFLFESQELYGTPGVFFGKSYLVPFLMWMNKAVQPNYAQYSNSDTFGVMSFQLDTIERKDSKGVWSPVYLKLSAWHHPIARAFSAERTPMDNYTNCPIFGILSHFDLTVFTFESCVGVMSEYCLHNDVYRFGLSLTHLLAACLRRNRYFYCDDDNNKCTRPALDVTGSNDGLLARDVEHCEILFDAMVKFLSFCSMHRGMQVVDRVIVGKAFGCVAATKEKKESVAYLRGCDATPSADELKAFNKVMGSVEALQLISQKPTLMTAQTVNQVAGSTEANEDNKDDKGSDPNQSADKKEEPSKPDENQGNEDDNSEPSPDEDGSEDLPSDDTTGGGEDLPDDLGGDDPAGGSSDPAAPDTTSAQPDSKPEEVTTSDDTGIKFEFVTSDSATVDTVLFREEMDKFLANLLTNPPKCMSPQDVQTLTALKRFWLHCLSIDTIKGIVEACVRLPKTFTNSIRKSTEQKQ